MIAGSLEIQLMANVARLQRDMDSARQVVGNATASMARAADMAKNALAGIAGAAGVGKIVAMVDEYSKLTAQLRLVSDGTRAYAQAYADVKRIASSSQSDLAATGSLYASLSRATKEMGVSQAKVADITESVNLAFKISGAGAQETAGALVQLSQAFASGALRGDEFNSVNEAAPRLMQAIADSLGKPVGALRAMAAEGKLTAEVVARALPQALGQLRTEASQIQTIAGAFQVLKDSAMEFVGIQAQSSGVVSVITTGIGAFANNLGMVAGAIGLIVGARFINWLSDAAERVTTAASANRALVASNLAVAESNAIEATQASLTANARLAEVRSATLAAQGNAQLALTTNALIPAQARAIAMAEAQSVALGQLTLAQRAASLGTAALAAGSTVLNGALALTGGPLGLIVTVLGAAAMAWSFYGDKAAEANAKAKGATEKSTQEIIDDLNKQNNKLLERIELAKQAGMGDIAKQGGESVDRLATLRGEILAQQDRVNAGTAGKDGSLHLIEMQYRYTDLANAIERTANSQTKLQAGTDTEKRQDWLAKHTDLLDKSAKIAAAIAAAKKELGTAFNADIEKSIRASLSKEDSQKATEAAKAQAKLLAELSGLSGTFNDDWNQLTAVYKGGKISVEQLTKAQADLLAKQPAMQAAAEAEAKAQKEAAEFNKRYSEGLEATSSVLEKMVTDAQAEATQNEETARTYGLSKAEIEQLTLSRLEDQLAQRVGLGLTLDEIDTLEKVIAAKKRSVVALGKVDSMEGAKKASEELDKFLDPAKAETFGEALRTAFGSAGDSISKLTGLMAKYGSQQAANEKARSDAAILAKGNDQDRAKAVIDLEKINRRSAQQQLGAYGDMAGAAAGFFDEHSRGYQALTRVSQVFHMAELAMTTAELVPKAISAVLSQGQGDPYTAFGRMAAMGALVAGLGVAIGGVNGGGANMAKDRQAANGTGSILGMSDAKSESLKKSLEMVEKNTYQDLAISTNMLVELQAINAGINGLGNILYRTDGFTTTASGVVQGSAANLTNTMFDPMSKFIGNKIGGIPAKIANAIFGGNVSTLDTGISLGQASLGQILTTGATVNQYANTRKDGGWFHSDKFSTQMTGLGSEVNDQFTKILAGMGASITEEARILGLNGDAFTAKLNSFVIDISRISTKDLKPEEVQAALQNALSKVGDDMAKFAIDGLQRFQQAGEGAFETLTRIASEYQTVDVVLDSFGKSFGSVGLASLDARDQLVSLAGGLEKFVSAGDYFLQNFFSDQEQANVLKKRVAPILSQYGLAADGEGATKAFRDFIVALDVTTDAGARAYNSLMSVAPALKAITDAQQHVIDERKGLQDQLDELTMTSAQLLEKQRNALDESNRALFDQVHALQSQKSAVEALFGNVDSQYSALQKIVGREKALLQARIEGETAIVNRLKSLSDMAHSALDSLVSAEQKLASRASAQAEIRADLAITKAGGSLSEAQIASLKKAFSVVSQDASSQFGTYTDYMRDLYQTQSDIAALADVTDDQLSVEQKVLEAAKDQLKALEGVLTDAQEQIDLLKGQSTTLVSINQGIAALAAAMATARQNPVVSSISAINGAYQTYLHRAPDAEGQAWWQNAAAMGAPITQVVDGIANSAEAKLNTLYETVLGRAPDAEGLAFWMKAYGPTMDAAEVEDWKKVAAKDPGYKLNSFDVGTNNVPYDMVAKVHAGERIIPAADNSALMDRLSKPADSEMAAAVDRLSATVERQQEALDQIQRNTRRQADTIDTLSEGGNALRTKGA